MLAEYVYYMQVRLLCLNMSCRVALGKSFIQYYPDFTLGKMAKHELLLLVAEKL